MLLLYALLLFTPLARGSVHPWAQTVIVLAVLALLILLLLEKITDQWSSCRETARHFNGNDTAPEKDIGTPEKDASCLIEGRNRLAKGSSSPAELGFPRTAVDVPLLVTLLLVVFSAAFSVHRTEAVEAVTMLLSYIALFYIIIHTVRTRKQQRMLVYVIIGVAVLLVVLGFLKRFDSLPVSWWDYPQHAGGYSGILTGPYGNRNHLVGYLEMAIPLLLGLFLTRRRRAPVFVALLCLTVFLVSAQILTLSRGGWLSLSLSAMVLVLTLFLQKRFQSKKLLFLLFMGCILLFLFILSDRQIVERILTLSEEHTLMEIGGRRVIWEGVVTMIGDFPFLGTGPGSFATAFTKYHPGVAARFYEAHNDYLHCIAEIGVVLVPLVCWLLAAVFVTGWKKLANPSNQVWGITLGAMTGIIAILIHSISDFNLHIPANAIVFTVLVALVCCKNGGGKKYTVRKSRSHWGELQPDKIRLE